MISCSTRAALSKRSADFSMCDAQPRLVRLINATNNMIFFKVRPLVFLPLHGIYASIAWSAW